MPCWWDSLPSFRSSRCRKGHSAFVRCQDKKSPGDILNSPGTLWNPLERSGSLPEICSKLFQSPSGRRPHNFQQLGKLRLLLTPKALPVCCCPPCSLDLSNCSSPLQEEQNQKAHDGHPSWKPKSNHMCRVVSAARERGGVLRKRSLSNRPPAYQGSPKRRRST